MSFKTLAKELNIEDLLQKIHSRLSSQVSKYDSRKCSKHILATKKGGRLGASYCVLRGYLYSVFRDMARHAHTFLTKACLAMYLYAKYLHSVFRDMARHAHTFLTKACLGVSSCGVLVLRIPSGRSPDDLLFEHSHSLVAFCDLTGWLVTVTSLRSFLMTWTSTWPKTRSSQQQDGRNFRV